MKVISPPAILVHAASMLDTACHMSGQKAHTVIYRASATRSLHRLGKCHSLRKHAAMHEGSGLQPSVHCCSTAAGLMWQLPMPVLAVQRITTVLPTFTAFAVSEQLPDPAAAWQVSWCPGNAPPATCAPASLSTSTWRGRTRCSTTSRSTTSRGAWGAALQTASGAVSVERVLAACTHGLGLWT